MINLDNWGTMYGPWVISIYKLVQHIDIPIIKTKTKSMKSFKHLIKWFSNSVKWKHVKTVHRGTIPNLKNPAWKLRSDTLNMELFFVCYVHNEVKWLSLNSSQIFPKVCACNIWKGAIKLWLLKNQHTKYWPFLWYMYYLVVLECIVSEVYNI